MENEAWFALARGSELSLLTISFLSRTKHSDTSEIGLEFNRQPSYCGFSYAPEMKGEKALP
jgi:hypothetical protein